MDPKNTSQLTDSLPKKRKSKRIPKNNDADIKESSIKKTKKRKKSNPSITTAKKITIMTISLALLAAGGFYGYQKYQSYSQNSVNIDKNTEHPDNPALNDLSPTFINTGLAFKMKDWTPEQLNQVRAIIQQYAPVPEIQKISHDTAFPTLSVLSYMMNDDFFLLDSDDINRYQTGYTKATTGITVDNAYNITNITPYSSAWRKGLRLSYKLEALDNKKLRSGLSPDEINNALTTYPTSKWMFNDSQGRRMTIKKIEKEYPSGDLAESWAYQNTLVLRIREMTKATPGVVNSLLNSRLKDSGLKGIIIDLRGSSDDIYSGLPELAWLLNQQKQQDLAITLDVNKNTEKLQTKTPDFAVDNAMLQKLNSLPRIVLVDYQTSGSFEVLAQNLIDNGAKINGTETSGSRYKREVFKIDDKHWISFKTKAVLNNNQSSIKIKPANNKVIFFVDTLYAEKRSQ